MPGIPSEYGGVVRVYESSLATQPAIWLRATAPKNLNDHDGDWEDIPIHLTVENARKLADQLNWLCNNHYQLRYLEDAEITE